PSCFGYPISIFFIVVNEFCERFSYYGMRAVLVLYFKYFLQWDNNLATVVYHTFVAVCYLTPILGAIVADSWLGKFKTIIYLSIVYAIGQVVMSVSAIHDLTDGNRDGTPDNLTLHVALSMIGLILIAFGTGGIKPCVAAFGGDQFEESQDKQRSRFFSIFYLSINAGSLLSTIITPILRVVFVVGSGMYKKVSPQGNIMVQVFKCISFAISNRFRNRSKSIPKREHWMDWAKEKYDDLLIAQIKMVVKVLFLYIPLPMFWALFDQQGAMQIQPDQMQRMTVGMFFAAMAFVAAALVQVSIDKTLPTFPTSTQIQVKVINLGTQNLTVNFRETQPPNFSTVVDPLQAGDYRALQLSSEMDVNYGNGTYPLSFANLSGGKRYTFIISNQNGLSSNLAEDITSKPEQGSNAIRFINNLQERINITVDVTSLGEISPFSFSNYTMQNLGVKKIKVITETGKSCTVDSMKFGFGSSYTIIINECTESMTLKYIEDIQPNTIHMALQIPQYFLITIGEAPSNMKSVLQAGWLLTVAVGNIIVLIVAGAAGLGEQWAEYVLFAALLVAVCIIFAVMAYFYTYVDPAEIEAQFDSDGNKKKEKEKEALGYEIGDGPQSQTKM
ncbi:hypothetical protein AB205_0032400, partial [Aquarana catesbeiana]